MAKLIDKDALVAEIERLREVQPLDEFQPKEQNKIDWLAGKLFTINSLEPFIDTLEVKEVDLEKECSQYFEDWTVQADLGLTKPDGWSCIVKDLYDIAKHFFTLGLKAKQG